MDELMMHPVFLSYARETNSSHAEALQRALGGREGPAFLDTVVGNPGEHFPPILVDALLGSKIVVLFVDEIYLKRFYCLWELQLALSPLLALPSGALESEVEAALSHLIIALPPQTDGRAILDALPARLRTRVWPKSDELETLRELVEQGLRTSQVTLAERLRALGQLEEVRTKFLERSALPSPVSLASFEPVHPHQWPETLGSSFVGRTNELWWLHFTLHTLRGEGSQGAALIGTLEAGGGFGKTTLALEYVHRFGRRYYPGGIFWVDADVSDDRLESQLHDILRSLVSSLDPAKDIPPLPLFREQGRDVRQELALALHTVPPEKPILYIVDNVPESIRDADPRRLEDWCPAVGKVSLLVTSRYRVSVGRRGAHALVVEVLSREAALQLLTKDVGGGALTQEEWERISAWVGYLPLALALLNRALSLGGVTPQELLSRIEAAGPAVEVDRQAEALRGQVPEEARRGISQTLTLSYERLPEETRRTACLLAFLAPAPIPVAILRALGPELDSPRIRNTLRARSFITPVQGGTEEFFGVMHRVLADFLQRQSQQPLEDILQLCSVIVKLLDRTARDELKQWSFLSACIPHAERIFATLVELTPATVTEQEVRLGLGMGSLFREMGLDLRVRKLHEQLFARATASLGSDHPLTVTVMHHLGSTLVSLGEFARAHSLLERGYTYVKQNAGSTSPVTFTSLGHLALAIREQGDLSRARTLLEQVVAGLEQLVGPEAPETVSAMNNLAQTMGMQADLPAAVGMFERVVEVASRTFGENNERTLIALIGLANVSMLRGEIAQAQVMYERVLESRTRTLGREHPSTLLVMSMLASALRNRGDSMKARQLQEEVLNLQLQLLGEEHPETLKNMNNLLVTLDEQGDVSGARVLQERLLTICRHKYGDKHPDTLLAMINFAAGCYTRGEHQQALEMEERAVGSMEEVLGREHPTTRKARMALARTLHALGNLNRARSIEESVLAMCVQAHGREHPDATIAAWNLFNTLLQMQEIPAAKEVLAHHLMWLSQREPHQLDSGQQKIRDMLIRQVLPSLRNS